MDTVAVVPRPMGRPGSNPSVVSEVLGKKVYMYFGVKFVEFVYI